MIILSGGVKRNAALVDDNGNLNVFSITEPEDKAINRQGAAWTVPISVTPAGANDYFFYFNNNGTKTYALTHLRAFCAAANTLSVRRVSGTPSFTSSTDLTPINRNLGFTVGMDAQIVQDTNATGLTNDGEVYYLRCHTANRSEVLDPTSNIIMPPGSKLAILATASNLITATASLAELL